MANILGIKLSDLRLPELLNKMDTFLNSDTCHFLVTPNPEIILNAAYDEEYFYILNSADIAIADGFGLVLAGLLSNQKIPRITGSDLTPLLIDKAEQEQTKTLIINFKEGLSSFDDIKKSLSNRWPKLIFKIIEIEKKVFLTSEENRQINDFGPKLIFVCLGAPYQEKLISHELKNWPSVRLALGVGGSFDFISGKIKRAPRIIRRLGLEWLWRLSSQPRRFKRIWRATIIFTLKVIKSTFIQPFLYRKNVAIMLYKKTTEGVKIAITARADDHSHWQLPQGGTDGESIKIAGAREAREELGTDKFIIKKTCKNIYKYRFSKLGNEKQIKNGYRGQKQSLMIAEFTGEDSDIKINYWDHVAWKWIELEKITKTLHPYRQEAIKKYLPYFLEIVK